MIIIGQYYAMVNTTNHESLNPHIMGLGLKEVEMTHGIMGKILIYLVTYSSDGGGGDIDHESVLGKAAKPRKNAKIRLFHGSWHNNMIWNVGDYDKSVIIGKTKPDDEGRQYDINHYDNPDNVDITIGVISEMIKVEPTLFLPDEYAVMLGAFNYTSHLSLEIPKEDRNYYSITEKDVKRNKEYHKLLLEGMEKSKAFWDH